MPLSEVKPGMIATIRTVFEGDNVEEFQAEILAVMDSFLGPRLDLIVARLKGDRVGVTGVAAGMSGSPVYVGGRLVGALSYSMGAFPKEPIAGITPIEYMVKVGTGKPVTRGASGPALSQGGSAASAYMGQFEPIQTAVVTSGVPEAAIRLFAADMDRLGLGHMVSGGSSASSSTSIAADRAPLKPGDSIAAQLVTGDISFAATGTVTHVDGDRVYAFGHPGLTNGTGDVPMARAEIYLTLPSLQSSTKISHVMETIGTFRESRLPGIAGVIGPKPVMIPVTVNVKSTETGLKQYHYQMIDNKEFTAPLVGVLAAASVFNTPDYSDEMTLSLAAKIQLDGHQDLVLNDLYSGVAGTPPAVATMSRDVAGLFGAVFANRFEPIRVTSVSLDISSVEKGKISFIEGVYPTRGEVAPGEKAEFRVLIRPYRGERYTKKFVYRVPEGTPQGTLSVYIGGAGMIGTTERNILARQISQADDINQLITLINRLRTSEKLYMKITRRLGGAIVLNEVMPSLPPSVLSTLGANRGAGEVTPLAETTLHEEEIVLDEILIGGTMVPLNIR